MKKNVDKGDKGVQNREKKNKASRIPTYDYDEF